MEKQNPFSLYDFLGYLIPGGMLIFGMILFRGVATSEAWNSIGWLNRFSWLARMELYVPLILLAYFLGHIVSFLSTLTVERFSIWTIGYASRFLFNRTEGIEPTSKFLCAVTYIFMAPISVVDSVLRHYFAFEKHYAKALDGRLSKVLAKKIEVFGVREGKLTREDMKECDVFRLIYHYVVEHSKNHLIKLQNYVALYGFLRTVCCVFIVFSWTSLVQAVYSFFIAPQSGLLWLAITTISSATAYVLYLDFVKFSRRFTLEAIMALAIIYDDAESNAK